MSVEQFGKAVIAAGLATAEQLKALWNALPLDARPKNSQAFADLLVERKLLTRFQAKELLSQSTTPLVLGDYVLLDKIGAGGMGQVFRARHRHMERLVAIKLLPATLTKDEASVKRFQREVKAAAKLAHPNIVQAFDASVQRGVWYLVMEHIGGRDLEALTREHGQLPVASAVEYILQAARGLAYAHAEGVVHRDIKPANLLLDRKGVVKILDMGLARFDASADDADNQLTGSGQVMGTVDYMPPEQAQSTHDCDARSDLYSLGCSLYRLLTCDSVYHGATAVKKILAHMNDPIPSLCAKRPDVPAEIDRIFRKMIAKAPDHRYQRADDLVKDLEAWQRADEAGGGSSANLDDQDSKLSEFFRSIEQIGGTRHGVSGATVMASAVTAAAQTALQPTLSRMTSEVVTSTQARGAIPKLAMKNVTALRHGNRPGKPPVAVLASVIGGFALVLFLGIWLVVRDKEGNEIARVQVPDGGSVERVTTNLPSPRVGEGPGVRGSAPGVRGVASPRAISKTPADPHRVAAEAVLNAGGTIRILLAERELNVSKLADLPAELFVLYSVRFDAPDKPLGEVVKSLVPIQRSLEGFQVLSPTDAKYFTDDHMALLSEMDCQVLKLANTGISDVSAARLASHRRVIDVALSNVGDAIAEAYQNWPHLNSIQFTRANLTATGFKALQRCPELTYLSYDDSKSLTGDSLRLLEKLPKLAALSLAKSPLDAGCVAALANLKQLRHLRIQNCGVSDEDAVRLQQALPQAFIEHPALSATSEVKKCIEWILQRGGEIADGNAVLIKSPDSLPAAPWSVKFTKDVPDGTEAARLNSLRFLKTLYWLGLDKADTALEHLSKLSSLDVLTITDSDLTGVGLRQLSKLDALNQLRLWRNGFLDDAALAELPPLPSLHLLYLDACPLYGPGLEYLSRAPNVQWLHLQDTAVTSDSLKHLVPLKMLRYLRLSSTPIDDSAIEHISQCTGLQRVQLNGTKVTRAGIERLHKALPHCTIQWDGPLVRPEPLDVAAPESPSVTDWGLGNAPDPAAAIHRRAAEAVLVAGGTVTIVTAPGEKTVSKLADLPSEPYAVWKVVILNSPTPLSGVIDAIAPIQRSLDALVIDRTDGQVTQLSNRDLEKLSNLHCRNVSLNKNGLTDACAKSLAGWRGVSELQLSYIGVGDDVCRALATWAGLVSLNLGQTRVTDDGIKALENCRVLNALNLASCQGITEKGLASIQRMPQLRFLDLRSTNLGDEIIDALAAATRLRHIELQGTRVSDEGARRLQSRLPQTYVNHPTAKLPPSEQELVRWALEQQARVRLGDQSQAKPDEPVRLPAETIDFAVRSPPASEAERFAQARSLQSLIWPGLVSADEAMAHVSKLDSLLSLSMAKSDLSGEGLGRLSALTSLGQFSLYSNPRLDDNALRQFPKLPSLWRLALDNCPITGPGLEHLQQAPQLDILSLGAAPLKSDALRHLIPLKHLRFLNVASTPIDDTAVPHLSQCTNLRRLSVRSTKMTERGIDQLHQALPQCIIQWNGGLVLPAVATPNQAGAASAASGPKANAGAKSADPHRAAAEAVLAAGGSMTVVTAAADKVVSKAADLPGEPFAVWRIDVNTANSGLSELVDALAPIQRAIDTLRLTDRPLGEAGVSRISDLDLKRLNWLDCWRLILNRSALTDAAAEVLASRPRVFEAGFTDAAVGDEICRAVATWPALRELYLRRTLVTDAGLEALASCQFLTDLELDSCQSVTSKGLASVVRLPLLDHLMLNDTNVGDEAIDLIASAKQLRHLGLQRSGFSDEGVRRLQTLMPQTYIDHSAAPVPPEEQEVVQWVIGQKGRVSNRDGAYFQRDDTVGSPADYIDLTNARVSASDAPRIAQAQRLRSLKWPNLLVGADEAASHLAGIPSLRQLDLTESDLTGKGLARLGTLTRLDRLVLTANQHLDDDALAHFPALPNLFVLTLSRCPINGHGVEHLQRAPNLQGLDLKSMPLETDSLRHLIPLKHLRMLSISSTPIDDAALVHLCQCAGLRRLDIRRTLITADGVQQLQQALPHCIIQWDGGLVPPEPQAGRKS